MARLESSASFGLMNDIAPRRGLNKNENERQNVLGQPEEGEREERREERELEGDGDACGRRCAVPGQGRDDARPARHARGHCRLGRKVRLDVALTKMRVIGMLTFLCTAER